LAETRLVVAKRDHGRSSKNARLHSATLKTATILCSKVPKSSIAALLNQ
jgi:hypothetical protein